MGGRRRGHLREDGRTPAIFARGTHRATDRDDVERLEQVDGSGRAGPYDASRSGRISSAGAGMPIAWPCR